MTDKKKRIIAIAAGGTLCAAVVVGIGLRFGGDVRSSNADTRESEESPAPTISIQNEGLDKPALPDIQTVDIQIPDVSSDPGAGAVSTGTEQTIQADPVKPEVPEPPQAPTTASQGGQAHTDEDVPEEERNLEQPPEYSQPPTAAPPSSTPIPASTPAPASTNSSGQVYVPGFGYVSSSGANDGGTLDDMYENGNKIGIMGGE